ncbi:MAG: DUF1992 domain-containing protein [Deltaproteobacteria bacterium]|jgi:hypothetical protein|nr:DUF1992 domain-containing protein [Deltaproteobacteria bacterium]
MVEHLVENILAVLAERKIAEAMEGGEFDNLPGKGKPLPEDELANLPDDVRLAYRILKMSGNLADSNPESPTPAKAPVEDTSAQQSETKGRAPLRSILEELDIGAPSEGSAYRHLESLRLRLGKDNPLKPEEENKLLDSGYLDKILEKLFPEKKPK